MDRTLYREDYYFTLGVREAATAEEIRDAYRALMKQYHPDFNEGSPRANERGKRINEAYEVLSDPKKKADYDRWLKQTTASATPQQDSANVNNDAPQDSYGHSSDSWYSEETFREKARHSQQQADVNVLLQWYRQQNLIRRLLAPKDFLPTAQGKGSESFSCLRSTTDYLDKKVSFDTTRYTMDVWAQNEARIISTSNNLNYIPTEFSDEHVEIFEDAKEIDCVNCNGLGYRSCSPTVPCSPTQQCGQCDGDGTIFINCTRCGGSGQRTLRRTCNRCKGSGWINEFNQCNRCNWNGQITYRRPCSGCAGRRGWSRRCANCGGQGIVKCSRCGGRGLVTCSRCNGRGRIDCSTCDTHGRLIQVRSRIHDFKKRSLVRFASESSKDDDYENGLRNGLRPADFSSLDGNLVHDEFETPDSSDIVQQRRRIENYGVLSYQYKYGKDDITINHISGAEGAARLRSPKGLPISPIRLSVAVVGASALLFGILVLLGLLAG